MFKYKDLLLHMLKKHPIFLIVLSLCLIQVKAGGPWVPGKKQGFAQTQATFPLVYTNQLFLNDGSKKTLARSVGDYTFQLYAEVGLSEKISFTTALPYKYVFTSGEKPLSNSNLQAGSLSGPGNAEFNLKYNFYNKQFLLSASLQTEMPTSVRDTALGLHTGFDTWALVPFIHIGKGFSNALYAHSNTGFALRGNGYSYEWRNLSEVGKKAGKNLWLAVVIDIRVSMYNGTRTDVAAEETGLYPNNQEWISYGLKAAYEHEGKIGFSVSGFGAAYGHLSAKAPFLNTGVYVKW